MPYFLERIANLLYDQTGGDLRRHCLVFPSRRAGIYFLKYLGARIEKPVWTPAIMTINDFFAGLSELSVAESEILLCELYKSYRKLNNSAESFDDFYFWGDMLINDFDDVDKYMANVPVLFRNVQDFRNIDLQFGDIDKEQAEIIKRFWINFEPEKPSVEKAEFKAVWAILNELYNEFRSSLRSKNLAYEGMIFRDIAENASLDENIAIKWDKVHFIGFNALNRCEETVLARLQKSGRASFYWDYDNSYIKGGKLNSAGLFLSRNLKLFKNDMPADWNYNTRLSMPAGETSRTVIETTSDVAQVKLIPELIRRLPGLTPENAHHTAIILADENLLVPVLTSLPENFADINISMGYPLKMTDVYALVRYVLNLQRNITISNYTVFFNYRDVIDILRHQLIEFLLKKGEKKIINEIVEKNLTRVPLEFLARTETLKLIFRVDKAPSQLSDHLREILMSVSADGLKEGGMERNLKNEFIYRVLLSINRLESVVRSSEISFKTETYIRILDKILRNQSVPFSGEPLSGIQIMGILETRALDFKNLIMFSVNEGILPGNTSGSSFIPYTIREAFGLPTINHQESIFAYHFYRLLHRAERVTLVYNSNSEGLRTGEMSRFIIQMKYEQILKTDIINLGFDIKTPVEIGEEIERKGKHNEALFKLYVENGGKTVLSPTAINTWLNCRMKFYYRYVNGLKEPEAISSEIDHALFGQILHSIMKHIYEDSPGIEILPEFLDSLIKDEGYLEAIIDKSFKEEVNSDISRPMDGNELIMRDILQIYLIRVLKADRSISPFTIVSLEKPFNFNLPLDPEGKAITIRTGGTVDRVDRVSGKTRIVDYKTGMVAHRINSLDDLFEDDRKGELDGWLQTLIYCEAFLSGNPEAIVKPSVYKVKELSDGNFYDTLRIKVEKCDDYVIEDYNWVRKDFMSSLRNLVGTIFSPEENFIMTTETRKCSYCPYRALCQR